MTAATKQTTTYWHPSVLATRRAPLLLLQGVTVPKGSVAYCHNGRIMPAGDFDNSNSTTLGGPLAVAGADGNGGLRVIALRNNVRFGITAGASMSATIIAVSYGTTIDITVTCDVTAVTSSVLANLLWGNALIAKLIRVNYTGTGAGLVAAAALALAPCVQVLGIAVFDLVNGLNPAADMPLTFSGVNFEFGRVFLANDGSYPVSALDVGTRCKLLDNITVTQKLSPLSFDFQLAEFSPDRGPALLIE
jgi:hypothetical protein